mmetsp:Transcript_34235/g.97270  ORF Transcript_34235/g.97270 Transcript_34235/m.97270 type:complete len:189 (-) Transcript_34235:123-689(-)
MLFAGVTANSGRHREARGREPHPDGDDSDGSVWGYALDGTPAASTTSRASGGSPTAVPKLDMAKAAAQRHSRRRPRNSMPAGGWLFGPCLAEPTPQCSKAERITAIPAYDRTCAGTSASRMDAGAGRTCDARSCDTTWLCNETEQEVVMKVNTVDDEHFPSVPLELYCAGSDAQGAGKNSGWRTCGLK